MKCLKSIGRAVVHAIENMQRSIMKAVLIPVLSMMLPLPILSFMSRPATAAPSSDSGLDLLVKLRREPPAQGSAALHASVGATLIRSFHAVGWDLVRLPEGLSLSEGLAKYRAHPDVLATEPSVTIHFQPPPPRPEQSESVFRATAMNGPITPNDPAWSAQWNLRKIGMPAAWAITTGASNVIVAVIDSGVDYTHEDLRDNMWRNPGESGLDASGKEKGTNGVDDDRNGYIDDLHGIDAGDHDSDPMDPGVPGEDRFYHGTAVAGVIGAAGNNSVGMAGVAWSTRIMALRLGGNRDGTQVGSKYKTDLASFLELYEYLIAMRRRGENVRVVNISWGGAFSSRAFRDAIHTAGVEAILTAASAGNEAYSTDLFSSVPAGLDTPYVISVANADDSDVLAPASNFGRSTVDLAAPGRRIYTTSGGNGYVELSGTSLAAPHVAAAASLLWAKNPTAALLEVKGALMQSVDQPSSLRGRVASNGRLNVGRALGMITNNTMFPPIVLGAFPGSSRSWTNAEIEIWFSIAMNRESVESSLRFTPPIVGTVRWDDGDRVLRLRPDVPLTRTNYNARLLGGARSATGETLDGDFDRKSEGSPDDDFAWGFRFAPANDDFTNPRQLDGTQGSIQDHTANASFEPDEPLANGYSFTPITLWYRWSAPTNTWLTIQAAGSAGFDTIAAVYQGTNLNSLTPVISDLETNAGSKISFSAQKDTAYSIAVGARLPISSAQGMFTLSWYPTPAPTFTATQFSPKTAMTGTKITLFGTNFTGATEVLFNGARAEFTPSLTNHSDFQIIATVPPDATDGPITIRTPHGDVTSSASLSVFPPPLRAGFNGNGRMEVSWPATSFIFVLESADDLREKLWKPVAPLVLTDGSTLFHPESSTGNRFYRLTKRLAIDHIDPRGIVPLD